MGRLCALVGRAVLGPVQCSLFKIFVPHLVSKKNNKKSNKYWEFACQWLDVSGCRQVPPDRLRLPLRDEFAVVVVLGQNSIFVLDENLQQTI